MAFGIVAGVGDRPGNAGKERLDHGGVSDYDGNEGFTTSPLGGGGGDGGLKGGVIIMGLAEVG